MSAKVSQRWVFSISSLLVKAWLALPQCCECRTWPFFVVCFLYVSLSDIWRWNFIKLHQHTLFKKRGILCVYRNSTNSQMKGQILGNYLYYWTNWSICKRSILSSRENITIRLILFYSFVNFTTLNFFYCLRYSYSILLLPIGTYCIFAGLMVT